MVTGYFLVIHNEIAVFTANVICLSALEKLGLYTGSLVSVSYLRVGEMGKEKGRTSEAHLVQGFTVERAGYNPHS